VPLSDERHIPRVVIDAYRKGGNDETGTCRSRNKEEKKWMEPVSHLLDDGGMDCNYASCRWRNYGGLLNQRLLTFDEPKVHEGKQKC